MRKFAVTWIALFTLAVLEIVLGIDNVIFISIRRQTARRETEAGATSGFGERHPTIKMLALQLPAPDRGEPQNLLRALEKPDDISTLFFDSIFRRNGRIAVQLFIEIERFLSCGLRACFISQASRQMCVTLQKIRS